MNGSLSVWKLTSSSKWRGCPGFRLAEVYYMKARRLSAAREAAERSSHPIDSYHERFKAHTWGSRSPLRLLVDFENFRVEHRSSGVLAD